MCMRIKLLLPSEKTIPGQVQEEECETGDITKTYQELFVKSLCIPQGIWSRLVVDSHVGV